MFKPLSKELLVLFSALPLLACVGEVDGPLPGTGGERATNAAPSGLKGVVDGLFTRNGQQVLAGWACKSGSPLSIEVELWAGGPVGKGQLVARFPSNASSEIAVGQACQTSGTRLRFAIPMDRCMRDIFGGQALHVYPVFAGQRGAPLARSGSFAAPATMTQAPAVCQHNAVERVVTHWDRSAHRVRFMATGYHGEGAAELPRTSGTKMWWGTLTATADLVNRVYPYAFLPQPNRYRGADFSMPSGPIYPLEARCLWRDICRESGISIKFLGADAWERGASEPKTRRVVSRSDQLQIVHAYRVYPTPQTESPANLFSKPGNNGSVSCHRYCENIGSSWGKPGTCVAGKLKGVAVSCDRTPGLLPAGEQLGCTCTSRFRKNLRGLVTVYLPPGWRADAPAGRYPIVFNGFYDLSQNVFRQEGPFMARLIADSSKGGKPGAIGVLWNGGGAHTSFTVTPGAYDQFANIIDQVARGLRGDRNRVFTFGGSRGGLTSLTMASNPDARAYRVVHASAAAPPTRLGQHLELFTPSLPALLSISDQITGLRGSWRTGWRYPTSAGNALGGVSNIEAVGRTILGLESAPDDLNQDGTVDERDTMAWADQHQSLLSARMLAGLKAAGTQVSLYSASFDSIVPAVHQFAYYAALRQRQIPVEGTFYVRGGHTVQSGLPSPVGQLSANQLATYRALQRTLSGQSPDYVINGHINYLRVDRQADALVPLVVPSQQFPFSVEFPRRVARGQRFSVVGVGTVGTLVRLLAEPDDGSAAIVFDKDAQGQPLKLESSSQHVAGAPRIGSFVVFTGFPAQGPKVSYTIRVLLKRPGSGSYLELDNTNVPGHQRRKAILELVTDEKQLGFSGHAAAKGLAELISPAAAGGSFRGVSWGISEY